MISEENEAKLKYFQFRDLHPHVFMGTASDRYAGWVGQIYSDRRYSNQIKRRSKTVGGKTYIEEVLPVECVEEYFRHFRILELDFTFYRPLLDSDGRPTQNLHLLRTYSQYLNTEDRLILKVPQTIFARKLRKGNGYLENEQYLDPEIFTRQFYEPALGLVAAWLDGLVFEQEYQLKQDRPSPKELAAELDAFFGAIPNDCRYHVELRTDTLLAGPVFNVLERHGVGQVLSHWTWLPRLSRQFAISGRRFLNSGRRCIVRLMTPRGTRYEDAYARAHPFNTLVEGMLDPKMIDETAWLMKKATDQGIQTNVIINNRAGGNAPLIAQQVARRFLAYMSN